MIRVSGVKTVLGGRVIHDGVSFVVNEGEIYGILGGSGSGKTTLLHQMIALLTPQEGEITIMGLHPNIPEEAEQLRRQWGVLFQSGALFTSLTVAENVAIVLRESTPLSEDVINEIISLKLAAVGLPPHAAKLYPRELSGGMVKRAALARALALDPKLLFLDEPTSGLDPISARAFDNLILRLREMLGLTVVMVTHDLDSIATVLDRMAILSEGRVIVEGDLNEVIRCPHPALADFFKLQRGKLGEMYGTQK
ncbi:MAG: ATP-binding cassette domain-containing protein [Campylobacterales bacterium]